VSSGQGSTIWKVIRYGKTRPHLPNAGQSVRIRDQSVYLHVLGSFRVRLRLRRLCPLRPQNSLRSFDHRKYLANAFAKSASAYPFANRSPIRNVCGLIPNRRSRFASHLSVIALLPRFASGHERHLIDRPLFILGSHRFSPARAMLRIQGGRPQSGPKRTPPPRPTLTGHFMSTVDFRWLSEPVVLKQTGPAFRPGAKSFIVPIPTAPLLSQLSQDPSL
jgi:hypothetical protein